MRIGTESTLVVCKGRYTMPNDGLTEFYKGSCVPVEAVQS
jgi:hypothetical protein